MLWFGELNYLKNISWNQFAKILLNKEIWFHENFSMIDKTSNAHLSSSKLCNVNRNGQGKKISR